ncbi:zinc finger BED domain-containing protein 5-like [Clavelina lepadiformis]|uniref:zinc finger BED domain-containing protein 5-like n=1 Tax=Clavelina lepadiformis TaxID=159417 RepID=UPI0040430916
MMAHTIAESLIMPAAKILVRQVIGEEAAAKLDIVPLSNNTVKNRIEEMSVDIADQVIAGVKASKFGFSIQLDESTDVTKCCQLLVYVRFTQDNSVKTELLMSQDLPSTTRGKDIFNVVNDFFRLNDLDWGKLVGCTTDGAPSMLGRKSGFTAHVKAVSPHTTIVHCFIHRFALCAKVLPPNMLSCLQRVIKIVNFVKSSALNTRLFKRLCDDLSSDHTCLLYYTEVRWLSRGNATRRLFELREELLQFCKEKNHDFQTDLESKEYILRLAYLADIFEVLNNFNLWLQGPNRTVTEFISKLGAFVRKLDLWIKNVENNSYGMFKVMDALENKPNDDISKEIVCHLSQLKTELMHYFPDFACCAYSTNPFFVDPADVPVGTGEQEELIDIQADETAKAKHKECCPINFWLSMVSSYPTLACHAVPQLLIFPSTWECEQGFSAMVTIKSKTRNRLVAPGHDFRCAVSKVIPRIDQLVEKKQIHPSH